MAREITYNINLSYSKNAAKINENSGNVVVNVAGSNTSGEIVSIPTSDTPLPLGGISTLGMVLLQNLDATNFVKISSNGAAFLIKLLPGEFCLFRAASAAIHAIADTAACKVKYLIIEE